MPLPSALRALRHRNFQLFFAGQLISLSGTWMQNVAQSWLVYRLTGSPALLGLVSFCGQAPVLFLSPLGGIVADRYNRHKVVVGTQLASMILALALAALTFSGAVRVWHIMLLAGLLGVVNAFDIPARQAFIMDMVGREDLMNAIALNSAIFNLSRVLGPAIAGILVASIGEAWCFLANGISYIAVIAGLLLMKPTIRIAPHREGNALVSIIEGFRFVLGAPPIFALLALLGTLSLTGMPFAVLMPIFADRILNGGATGLGILMGTSGVGALAGALTLASRTSVRGLGKWVAVSAMAFGSGLILFSLSRSFRVSAALMVPIGFSMMIEMGSSNTLIQSMTPDHLRGRVMSVYSMMFMGVAPFGALLAGLAAERLGAPLAVAAGGAICLAASAVFAFYLPSLRAEARSLIVAQQMAAGDPPQEMTGGTVVYDPRKER
jgi:MFS family permease